MLPQLAFAFNGANLRCPKIRSAIQMAITIKDHRQRVQHKRRPKWFVYKSGKKWLCCKKVAIQRQIMQNNIFPVYSPHKFRHKLLYPEPPPLPGTRSIEFHLSWSVIYPDSAEKKNRSGFRIPINLTGEEGLLRGTTLHEETILLMLMSCYLEGCCYSVNMSILWRLSLGLTDNI